MHIAYSDIFKVNVLRFFYVRSYISGEVPLSLKNPNHRIIQCHASPHESPRRGTLPSFYRAACNSDTV